MYRLFSDWLPPITLTQHQHRLKRNYNLSSGSSPFDSFTIFMIMGTVASLFHWSRFSILDFEAWYLKTLNLKPSRLFQKRLFECDQETFSWMILVNVSWGRNYWIELDCYTPVRSLPPWSYLRWTKISGKPVPLGVPKVRPSDSKKILLSLWFAISPDS